MSEQFIIELEYTAEDSRRQNYVKVPIPIPFECDRLEVAYSYERFKEEYSGGKNVKTEINIIDLGLYNPEGVLYGWSGSDRSSFFITPAASTPGYRKSVIKEGTWFVALGLYKITDAVRVTLTCTVQQAPGRYVLSGDLHMHTVNSDGIYTPEETMTLAKHAGLDFIALTDHNVTQQNAHSAAAQDIIVIPGMEYTHYKGHANFFFPDDGHIFNGNPLSNSFEEMTAALSQAQAEGALISLNHPFDEGCPWLFGFDGFCFDCVEIWNGPFKNSDLRALNWWHGELTRGRKLVAIGGSDVHRNTLLTVHGTPATCVLATEKTRTGVLAALKNGRAFIMYQPNGPKLSLTIDGASFGDTARYRTDTRARLTVQNVKKGDLIKIISDRATEYEYPIDFNGSFETDFSLTPVQFYRVELWRSLLHSSPIPAALSNPVWIET